jgi:hypothetical protein
MVPGEESGETGFTVSGGHNVSPLSSPGTTWRARNVRGMRCLSTAFRRKLLGLGEIPGGKWVFRIFDLFPVLVP